MDKLITNQVYRFLFENSYDALFLTHYKRAAFYWFRGMDFAA